MKTKPTFGCVRKRGTGHAWERRGRWCQFSPSISDLAPSLTDGEGGLGTCRYEGDRSSSNAITAANQHGTVSRSLHSKPRFSSCLPPSHLSFSQETFTEPLLGTLLTHSPEDAGVNKTDTCPRHVETPVWGWEWCFPSLSSWCLPRRHLAQGALLG